jgi:hypothetical protein
MSCVRQRTELERQLSLVEKRLVDEKNSIKQKFASHLAVCVIAALVSERFDYLQNVALVSISCDRSEFDWSCPYLPVKVDDE